MVSEPYATRSSWLQSAASVSVCTQPGSPSPFDLWLGVLILFFLRLQDWLWPLLLVWLRRNPLLRGFLLPARHLLVESGGVSR